MICPEGRAWNTLRPGCMKVHIQARLDKVINMIHCMYDNLFTQEIPVHST